MPIETIKVIEFDERPALRFDIASEQLEHLYIHVGLIEEKLNEMIETFERHTHSYHSHLLMKNVKTSHYGD